MKIKIGLFVIIFCLLIFGGNLELYAYVYDADCHIEIITDSSQDYFVENASVDNYTIMIYNRNIKNEDCYIKFYTTADLEQTVQIDIFGTLNKIGTMDVNGDGRIYHIYQAPITNKTIFDEDIEGTIIKDSHGIKFDYQIKFRDVKNINDLEINIDTTNKEYTGEEIKTSIAIRDGEYTLIEDIDYFVNYYSNYGVGTATVSICGTGNYYGTIKRQFNIEKIELSKVANIIIDADNVQYTSDNIEPSVIVKSGEKTLTKEVNYTVSYENNKNVGTATIIVTGTGNYTGTVTKQFEILKKDISTLGITVDTNMAMYTGSPIEKDFKLYNGKQLEIGKDYTVEYKDNINVGTASIIITGIGDCYTGTITKTFEIIPGYFSEIIIDTSSKIYTGQPITTTVTVKDGEKILVLGKDYTVKYKNNIDVGYATVSVKGIGNYSGNGERTEHFDILPINLNTLKEIIINTDDKKYTGEKIQTEVQIKDEEVLLKCGTDYTIVYENNIYLGTATVTIYGRGNYGGIITKNFKIIPKDITELETRIDKEDKIYSGNTRILEEILIKYGDITLKQESDYRVEYENNINVGTATARIIGIGNYVGTTIKEFKIVEKKISELVWNVDTGDKVYTGSEIRPQVNSSTYENMTLELGKDYIVEYTNNKNVGTASITITGQGNYIGTINKQFEILRKDLADLELIVDTTDKVYTGTNIDPEVNVLKYGDIILEKEKDYVVEYINNKKVGRSNITITGKGNYTGSINKTFKITEKNINELELNVDTSDKIYTGSEIVSDVISIEYGDITLELEKDYTVEYKDNINVGTAILTITGIGNYTGTVTETYKIVAKDITNLEAEINTEDKVYTGNLITTEISTLKYGDIILKERTDYKVEYKDNINVGTATVTITGIGNYAGTITKNFEIISENTDYKYTILDDGTIEINEYIGYDTQIVEIPSKIDGYKVTKIGKNAFVNEYLNDSETDILSHNRQHKKVIIPERIVSIGEDAFVDCNLLSEVLLPSTLVSIGDRAFQKCTSLKEIVIPDTTTVIGVGAFWGNSSLEKVDLPKNITEINDSTFAHCTSLKEIVIPEKVQTINEMAFYECTSIQKIEIPKSVSTIKWESFGSCSELVEVIFKENTEIEIQTGAFYNCSKLIKIVLPKTITDIKADGNIFEGANNELVIHVDNGSYAHQFCIDNNYTTQLKELKDLLIEISNAKVYTGNFTRTEIFIKDGEYTLKENIDYKTEYKNNINVGTASLTIIGIGDYIGTIEKQFEIEPQNISSVSGIPLYGGKTYTGQEIKLDLIVKGHNDSILVENQDYIVEYSNNINVGTAHLKVIGIGNYKGTTTGSFYIASRYLHELDIMIDTSDKTYSNIQAGVTTTINIKHNDIELKENEDYSLTYEGNDKVGIAWVYITGVGNYAGKISGSYNILPKDIKNMQISVDTNDIIYTGQGIEPKVEIEGLTAWEDYTVNYEDCINAGTMNIIITGITNYTGTVTKQVDILPKNIQDIPVMLGNRLYNGQEQKNIARFDALREGRDYIETYQNNINVGTATVIITGVGNYTGTITKNFKIEPIHIQSDLIIADTSNKIYNGHEMTPTVQVKDLIKGIDYTVTYQNNINAGTATIYVTGIGNYTGRTEFNFIIEKATIENNSSDSEAWFGGSGTTITNRFNFKSGTQNDSDFNIRYSVNNTNYDLTDLPYFKDVGEYTVNYKVTKLNHHDLIGSNKVRIYGIKGFDSTLQLRENGYTLAIMDYNNSFKVICNRINLFAKSVSYTHYNSLGEIINTDLTKTGDEIYLKLNNDYGHKYKISILGDVNGDGKISALDYVKIKNHIMKTNLITLLSAYSTAADVNNDGKISALDYVKIKNYIMNEGV